MTASRCLELNTSHPREPSSLRLKSQKSSRDLSSDICAFAPLERPRAIGRGRHGCTASFWVKVEAEWRKSIAAIFKVGELLIAEKAKQRHGGWGKLFDDERAPFTLDTAERLMAVAGDKRLRKSAHGRLLPTSWRTLYELSLLSDAQFKDGMKSGAIHPEMTRADVENLRRIKVTASEATEIHA